MKWSTAVWSDAEDPEWLPDTETYREALEQAQNHVRGTDKHYKIVGIGTVADTLSDFRRFTCSNLTEDELDWMEEIFRYRPPKSLRQRIFEHWKAGVITKGQADEICDNLRLFRVTESGIFKK